MKKKLAALLIVFVCVCCTSLSAFAASASCSVSSSLPLGYSLPLTRDQTVDITFTVNTASYAGKLIEIPLLGNWAAGDSGGVAYLSTHEGATWAVHDVVDGAGLPLLYRVNDNTLIVVPNNAGLNLTTFTLTVSAASVVLDVTENLITTNGNVQITVHGDMSGISLAKFLEAFHYQQSEILNNVDLIKDYAEFLSTIDADTSLIADNIYWMAKDLTAISADVQGVVHGGKSYNVLLQEILAAVSNISFGDIGDITVETDLTEVLTRLDTIFSALDNLEDIEDKTAYLSTQLTELIALLTEQKESLDAIGLDVQALLDLLGSDEFLGYIEDRLDLLLEEQKISNKTLQDILTVLQDVRDSLVYGGGSGSSGGGGSATGNSFSRVIDALLGGILDLLGNLLGLLFKVVFGLFGWLTNFVGWVNTTYLGGFFPAAIWGPISVIIPLIVVLGLIRFVRGFF